MTKLYLKQRKTKTKALKEFIRKGFIPKSYDELKAYQKIFPSLSVSDEGLILKDAKIILPASLRELALAKAHQGGHPGMNGLKRRIRSHFWFPKMDNAIKKKVEGCKECLMFTNKTTHEPLHHHQTSQNSWEDVSVDLFGPMPNGKHVVAVLDKTSRFPAAKIVGNTSAPVVTKALSGIYADYGQPESHQTDNGPPFNSVAFEDFSKRNGITHIKTYPYHPQGNPVENFMRPLGKSMKAAHYNREGKEEALDQMLSNYRATPHPATGLPPGDIMFRSGYKKDFPREVPNQRDIEQALSKDQEKREKRSVVINNSNHRTQTKVSPGDHVIVRNMVRNKFDPLLGPNIYKVIELRGNGVTLISLLNDRLVRRHLDDVKLVSYETEDETCWLDSYQQVDVQPMTHPEVQTDNIPGQSEPEDQGERNIRPQRQRRPPPRFDDYVM